MDEGLGVVVAKALLNSFAEKVSQLDKAVTKNVCEFALSRLLNRTVSFEEQVREGEWHGGVAFEMLSSLLRRRHKWDWRWPRSMRRSRIGEKVLTFCVGYQWTLGRSKFHANLHYHEFRGYPSPRRTLSFRPFIWGVEIMSNVRLLKYSWLQ